MSNRITTVQVCDATDDDSSTAAGNKKIKRVKRFIKQKM